MFCCSYVESILENGAMAVNTIMIHEPLVLNGTSSLPGHAGCVIDDDKWEFRVTTTPNYNNGKIILDLHNGALRGLDHAYSTLCKDVHAEGVAGSVVLGKERPTVEADL